jgi:hypothetical protein
VISYLVSVELFNFSTTMVTTYNYALAGRTVVVVGGYNTGGPRA